MELRTIKNIEMSESVKELLNGACYYDCSLNGGIWLPCNIPFNKVLYMVKNNELIALKFIMATFVNLINDNTKFKGYKGLYYLIQTPFGVEWVDDFKSNTRFFESKEEYFHYVENGKGGFEIEKKQIFFLCKLEHCDRNYFLNAYAWNGQTAYPTSCSIDNIIMNEDGVTIVLSKSDEDYWTKEECVKAKLNGMRIVDFPQTDFSVNVNIDIIPSKPIIRTLQFIEK